MNATPTKLVLATLAMGVLALAAPESRASVIFDEFFNASDSITNPDPHLTLDAHASSHLHWTDGVGDGVAGPADGSGTIYSTERGTGEPSRAYLVYQIDAPAGQQISDPSATITIHTLVASYSVTLEASTDGSVWEHAASDSTSSKTNTAVLMIDQAADADYDNLATVYYRIGMPTFLDASSGVTKLAWLDSVEIQGALSAVPEPGSLALLGLGGMLVGLRRRRR